MNRIFKLSLVLSMLISLSLFYSCEKEDNNVDKKTKIERGEFEPLEVIDRDKVNIDLMTGKKIVSKTKDEQFGFGYYWKDGWLYAFTLLEGWKLVGTYQRYLEEARWECFKGKGNCLPTVEVKSGIVNIEDDDEGTPDEIFISEEVAAFINLEYGESMYEAAMNEYYAFERYFEGAPQSIAGLCLHDFLNYNFHVQEHLYHKYITFKKFGDEYFVVSRWAENSTECPDYFFDPNYEVQSNNNERNILTGEYALYKAKYFTE